MKTDYCTCVPQMLLLLLVPTLVLSGYVPPGPLYRCPDKPLLLYPCECVSGSDVGLNVLCENSNLASLSVGLANLASLDAPVERLVLSKCHFRFLRPVCQIQRCSVCRSAVRQPAVPAARARAGDPRHAAAAGGGAQLPGGEPHAAGAAPAAHRAAGVPRARSARARQPQHAAHRGARLQRPAGRRLQRGAARHPPGAPAPHPRPAGGAAARRLPAPPQAQDAGSPWQRPGGAAAQPVPRAAGHRGAGPVAQQPEPRGLVAPRGPQQDVLVQPVAQRHRRAHQSVVKNLKVRIYKTVILPVVLYGCETWTLTLREEHRLRVFENKVLRKIFGAKRDEVTGEWRKLHNTELHALYSSPDIIRDIKSRRLRWAGHVARMGESRNAYRVLVGRPLWRPRRRWEDDIKIDLKEVGYDAKDWINLVQNRDRWRAYGDVRPQHSSAGAAHVPQPAEAPGLQLVPWHAVHPTPLLQRQPDHRRGQRHVRLRDSCGHHRPGQEPHQEDRLPDVPPAATRGVSARVLMLQLIDVSENQVTEVQKLSFKDLYLVRINLSHNAIERIESGAFENCANITLLDLSHNNISSIPRTAFDSTTYALELTLTHNLLTDLSQVPLHNMTGLKILNVSHNLIEKVPRNTFPKLYELHTVDLSHNRIRDIWNSVFQSLFSLRFLNLSHNALAAVKGSTFGALHTLLELDLSHNVLGDVNRAALARCASLRSLTLRNNSLSRVFQLPISLSHLDLSHNSIASIPPLETWPTMNSLLSLDLSHNALGDSLERGAFANLLTLQRLNLEANNMTTVPWESLAELSTLQFLNMQHNGLSKLERGAFGRLPVVFDLNLAHNRISNVTTRAFEGLLQLLTLNLTANNLTSIPNGAFQGLVSLRTLDLSHNRLEKLDNKTHGLLDDCLSLERVNLSHNKISFVTRHTFPSSPWVPYRLREVDLSYNVMPVLTYDITIGTQRVEVLNVSHNLLNEIRNNVLGNLTAVRVLDLSHNELTQLPASVFRPPRNLSALFLQHNLLGALPLEQLAKARLRVLDVRDNRLPRWHHALMPLVENGTRVRYGGNPVTCDCEGRPLHQWLASQVAPDPEWGALICSAPPFLQGQALASVPEDRLTCDKAQRSPQFEINPDVKFREIQRTGSGVAVTWFVSTRSDVADFRLVVREGQAVVLERDLPYSARSAAIAKLPAGPHLELCLLTRDSVGNVRRWRANQCAMLTPGAGGAYYTPGSSAAPLATPLCLLLLVVTLL
ncbi:hypothetical protein ANN_05638 [Periplaneta americana]|uniref:LRRCT domain-containing protein n=1 Tax=Periplaneta americana TaxID=6978 RepID=A0ABQ8TD34_PERAM|nr:hypothetical protein ANN_05638 [Periplaneta americana]